MSERVELTLAFVDRDGNRRESIRAVFTEHDADSETEHRVAWALEVELRFTSGHHRAPAYNEVAQRWLEVPERQWNFLTEFDVQNSQALWFELSNLILRAEHDLISSEVFKSLEPQGVSFEDDRAVNDLFLVHNRKSVVQDLVKVQDLVNRLLHESLGGDLVDTTVNDWERSQLTRGRVELGLRRKLDRGYITRQDFDAIKAAVSIPDTASKRALVVEYRNRMTHHVQPSVDYPNFYSYVEPRVWHEIKDETGKTIGKSRTIRAFPPMVYSFSQLHEAYAEYLDAVVAMLDELSRIALLRA